MNPRLEHTTDLYRAFTEFGAEDTPEDIVQEIRERGLDIHDEHGTVEPEVLTAITQKAMERLDATEFESRPPTEDSPVDDADIETGVSGLIDIYSYSIDRTGRRKRNEPTSEHSMYIEEETGVPVCTCPEMEKGGVLCHHMIAHALKSK